MGFELSMQHSSAIPRFTERNPDGCAKVAVPTPMYRTGNLRVLENP